ncbi:hypothetical protein [Actinocrispum wychmicini]|uniref:Uncharacterized protein n=1 Tax=Actinocrispum wychmicini TaxID=1213861 RepID=A0A4R2JF92_9PSEU|nr:hypothetical protein [Actinocrispum wychmicini]TCO56892.1 hypothetical protein EV192_106367 [Actinocrispum wychmicini]
MTRYGLVIAQVRGSDGTYSVYAVEGHRTNDHGRSLLYLRYVGRTLPGRRDVEEITPDPGNLAGAIWLPAELFSPFTPPF